MYRESLQPIVDKVKSLNDECYVHSYSKDSIVWCFNDKVFSITSLNGMYSIYLHIEPTIKYGNSILLNHNLTLSQVLHFMSIPKIVYPNYIQNTIGIKAIKKERYLKIDARTISRVA